jgi:hypothetical protein
MGWEDTDRYAAPCLNLSRLSLLNMSIDLMKRVLHILMICILETFEIHQVGKYGCHKFQRGFLILDVTAYTNLRIHYNLRTACWFVELGND